jgi:hypothetical protein
MRDMADDVRYIVTKGAQSKLSIGDSISRNSKGYTRHQPFPRPMWEVSRSLPSVELAIDRAHYARRRAQVLAELAEIDAILAGEK